MAGGGPSGRPLSFSPTGSGGRGCGTVGVGRPVALHSTTSWRARGAGPWELDTRNRDGRPVAPSLRPVGHTGTVPAGGGDRPWDFAVLKLERGTGTGDRDRPTLKDQLVTTRYRGRDGRPGSGSLGSGDWDRPTLADQLVRGRPRDRPARSGRPPRFEGGRGTGRHQTVRTGPGGRRVGRIVGQRGQNVRTGPVGELVQKSGFRPPAKTLGRIKLRKTVPVPPTSTSWLSLPDPFPALF